MPRKTRGGSAATAKDFTRIDWHAPKELVGNDGILVRAINSSDGTNGAGFTISIFYHE